MNGRVLLVGLLVVVPLVLFLALGFRTDPRTIESPLLGKPAPPFTLESLSGETVSLADLRGRPVVINFWATWCQPCIAEHPVLLEAAQRYGDRAAFLGVIYQDDPELIRRFVASNGAWGPSLLDPENRVAIAYGVYGAPETFFIDPEGVVAEKIVGPMGLASIGDLVEGLQ